LHNCAYFIAISDLNKRQCYQFGYVFCVAYEVISRKFFELFVADRHKLQVFTETHNLAMIQPTASKGIQVTEWHH